MRLENIEFTLQELQDLVTFSEMCMKGELHESRCCTCDYTITVLVHYLALTDAVIRIICHEFLFCLFSIATVNSSALT